MVRLLLVMRDREIVPRLAGRHPFATKLRETRKPLIHISWTLADGSALMLLANLSADVIPFDFALPGREPLWGRSPDTALSPWQVVWWLEAT
jgi:hypothetical protein